jgi:hypothetical protein
MRRKKEMKKRVKVIVIVIILMLSIVIYAETPRQLLGYTGFLVDKTTLQPYTGTMNMRFKLYESETASISVSGAGGYLWYEEHASIPFYTDNPGEFSIELGNQTAFLPNIDFTKQYWLGIEVNITDFGDAPVAANEHRFKLFMVPYSFTTSGVETYTGSDPASPKDGQIWLRTDL